ncbi:MULTISPECIES: MMPL family transporter [unclassified Modicisalibacter]|uniref:MMPL family transporter n=1 Tax=unclassified Modicisalibacter TaxID=2679913 RepID=UPI001CC90AF8|nr:MULTISPECIES: MMPL family transporter [unclassified Modicisalibacter]MBZ9559932.1 MMPL family transporter [Modicisalibacter sp. R2A 31.J]MBZ9575840.1 MMPL family transporter [Modicisalibacter sp. MOD 31.J]
MTPADSTDRRLARLWGVVLLIALGVFVWQVRDGLPTDTRLTALLPPDRQSPLIERAGEQLGQPFADRFVLLVSAPDLGDAAGALAEALGAADDGRLVARLDWRDVDLADADPRESLDRYRYRLLPPALRETIHTDGGTSLVQPALERLFSPTASPQPVADPFDLLDRWLAARDNSPVTPWHGLLTVRGDDGTRHALLIGQLAANPYSLPAQQALTETLAAFESAHPEASLLHSGLIFHAAAGARQARHEITTIGLGAFVGLIAILLAVFRSPRTLVSLLLPLGCGLLVALPLTLALFGRLHLMTLAFGASLIGVAIDYALHLQCDRAIQGRAFRLRALLPGLTLGLVSSLAAYLAQALTPLPGLRQMAVFAAAGLAGAWLTVVLWLPRLRLPAHPATARIAERLWRLTTPRIRRPRGVAVIAVGLSLALLGLIAARLTVDDSLRLLNPSSAARLAEERQVQHLLGSDTGSHFLLVTAPDEPALLSRLAALGDALDAAIADGLSIGYDDLADRVPPPAVQDANLAAVTTLYGEPLATLVERAGLPERVIRDARARLDGVPRLDVASWLAMPAGQGDRRLWLGRVAQHGSDTLAATLVLTGLDTPAEVARIEAIAHAREGTIYVDRVARLSGLLGELRRHIAVWVGVALAALTLLLVWRYRWRAWRVVAPPLGALLGVLAVFAALGIPLNVFSQLGLLLVLGIGLDAGIFSAEHGRRPATWLAISLSTLTSVLAFGLLAFSATPALHYLGLTCLIGLTLVWLLVPWVRLDPPPAKESAHGNDHP